MLQTVAGGGLNRQVFRGRRGFEERQAARGIQDIINAPTAICGPAVLPKVPVKPRELVHASAWFNRYGIWLLLLAWVPIIGDPITLAAEVLRTRFLLFLLLVAISKTGRYAVLLGTVDWLWP